MAGKEKWMSEAWIRKRFKAWRKREGLTLREVAEMTGISNPFLSQFETGKTGIGFDRGITLIGIISAPSESGKP